MGRLILLLALAILANLSSSQFFEEVEEPNNWPQDYPSIDEYEESDNDENLSSIDLEDLLNSEVDLEEYDEELEDLRESIDLVKEDIEEEEETNYLEFLDALESMKNDGYLSEVEDPSPPKCEGFGCNENIVVPQLFEEEKNSRRLKRSPAPSPRRSSSRRSSSSSGSSGGSWSTRRSSSSRSSSSSSGSSSSSSSRSGSSWFGRRRSSSSSNRGTTSTSSSSGSTSSSGSSSSGSSGSGSTGTSGSTYGWNTGSSGSTSGIKPATGTGVVAGTTSSGSSYPKQPYGGYPSGTGTSGGYPTGTQPAGGYPGGTRPAGGYPSGTSTSGGYPTGTQPVGGYPGGTRPAGGYPTGTQPVGGYPGGTRPAGGYPTGTQPVGGYPGGTRPAGGYPGGSYPTNTGPVAGYPGYPSGSRPFGSTNQPFGGGYYGNQGGYSGYQPYSGYGGYSAGSSSFGSFPTRGSSFGGFRQAGFASGGFAAGGFGASHYPVGGFPKPLRKKTKKEKVKDLVKKVGTAYVAHKAYKKSKYISPFGHSGMGMGMGMGMGRGFGGHKLGGLGGGALAGMAVGKTAKKILGAYVKIKIAKYALKFGAEAAKAYFRYKMGLELDDYMVGKFVHRYHQHRVYGGSRWRHRTHYQTHALPAGEENDNITLGEFCHRPCNTSDKRVCQFSLEVHLYQTMSRACYNCPSNITDCERPECIAADGTRRMVVAVNKAIPGPSIQVCAGDKVLVDVFNNLPSTSVAIHWHGLTLSPSFAVPTARATPFMDGVPGVTQCPIPPGSGFRYSFDATDPGTHFWHAQTGLERGDGVFGPLVVHQTMDKDPMQGIPEHIFVVNDWFHSSTQSKYILKLNSGEEAKPKSILINGQGRHKHGDSGSQIPYFNFLVEKNKRYRLRMINAATTNCPVTISVDSHDLILLSADGSSINPVNASTVLIHPGERYDGMFSAEEETGEDGATFWIRVRGGQDCDGLEQFASLQYLPSNITATPIPTIPPNTNPATTPSRSISMDVFTGSCSTQGQRCVSGLRSSTSLPQALKTPKAEHTFYLAFSKRYIHNENFYSLIFYNIEDDEPSKRVATPQINYLTFRGPSTPLLVNQRPLKNENCSAEAVRRGDCTEDFCECLHTMAVPVGATVDFVLISEGDDRGLSQPVHLHGYKFWVLAQVEAASVPELVIPASENITLPEGMSRYKAMRLDEEGHLPRYTESPVVKDTVTIPPGGYTIVRIAAENKGFWMLESQVLFDSQAGMSLVLQVGSEQDIPKAPKDFPTC